ncbi:MAG: helix-turn-helix domain-containing protein [Oscillospiraceae bacterium]
MRINLSQKHLARGLSVRQLSELSRVSRATITRIENSDCNPTIEPLCKLVRALGITLNDLIPCDQMRE